MGFTKKFVTKEIIDEQIKNNKSIKELFKFDSLIFTDEVSHKVCQLINNNVNEIEIINFFNENK